jgi:hypothetical protein
MCLCDHYRVSPRDIYNWEDDKEWKPSKSPKVQSVKHLLAYHLYECGMSYDAIARFVKLDTYTIRTHYAKGKNIVLGGMRDFVDALPKITTTLELTTI